MNFDLNAVFSLSVGIGAVIGWIRFKKIDPAFFPFLLLMWVALLQETLSIILSREGYSNALNYNIYSLAEALLLTWQFRRWGLFRGKEIIYPLIQWSYAGAWVIESLTIHSVNTFNSGFLIGYSFLILLMSVVMINRLLVREPYYLLRNSRFLILMALMIYFTYAVLVEAFWLFGLNRSRFFRIRIYEILSYINLFTNLIYAVAILWMPMKPRYILRC
jgi:hypothetical protein